MAEDAGTSGVFVTLFESTLDERNRMMRLLRRYIMGHSDQAVDGYCECALCMETRFTLSSVRVRGE